MSQIEQVYLFTSIRQMGVLEQSNGWLLQTDVDTELKSATYAPTHLSLDAVRRRLWFFCLPERQIYCIYLTMTSALETEIKRAGGIAQFPPGLTAILASYADAAYITSAYSLEEKALKPRGVCVDRVGGHAVVVLSDKIIRVSLENPKTATCIATGHFNDVDGILQDEKDDFIFFDRRDSSLCCLGRSNGSIAILAKSSVQFCKEDHERLQFRWMAIPSTPGHGSILIVDDNGFYFTYHTVKKAVLPAEGCKADSRKPQNL